jgi:hypothetical protein
MPSLFYKEFWDVIGWPNARGLEWHKYCPNPKV